jgi:uncharacterized protein YhfF
MTTDLTEDHLEQFAFGYDAATADELLALVLAGTKTATCGPLHEYEKEGVPLPRPGKRSVILDGQGVPACVIETTEVTRVRFDTVTAAFAREEGEGDSSLSAWREIHEKFFHQHGGFSSDMVLVCRKFRVIERFDRSAQS